MPDRIPQDDLTDLERRLTALRPTAQALDRDRMLFEAGRASARGEGRAWVLSAAASALMVVGLGVALARERSRALGLERDLIAAGEVPAAPPIAVTAAPREPSPPVEVAPDSYLALSRRALAGLDDLPAAPPHPPGDLGPPAPGRVLSPLRSRGAEGLRDL
jgi:hypothetical protein